MLPIVHVSRREHFNAAHKLYNPSWNLQKNLEVFGPCANENWHGHNYDLTVTVAGQTDPDTGFVVDLKQLSILIRTAIIEEVDHKNLNLDVPFMAGKMASTENLAIGFWEILEPRISEISRFGKLYSIRLYETTSNYVEYFGPQRS